MAPYSRFQVQNHNHLQYCPLPYTRYPFPVTRYPIPVTGDPRALFPFLGGQWVRLSRKQLLLISTTVHVHVELPFELGPEGKGKVKVSCP